MRKLVTIQQVKSLEPIHGADFIEVASVLGWQCVVKKGEFKVGDLGVYFEVDSYLPINDRFEFLRNSCYRKNELLGEGLRIKTTRLKGVLSQGLLLPLDMFPEIQTHHIGKDVTNILKVKKWEIPESIGDLGTIIGDKPYGIPTTDEIRIQSAEYILDHFLSKSYYITTKLDGASCTMYVKAGKFGVCGRNFEYKEDMSSPMWKYAVESGIKDRMISFDGDIAIQGEFCGPGIQGNKLKLRNFEFYAFDIYDIKRMKYLDLIDFVEITDALDIKKVPLEEIGICFDYNQGDLLERATGLYLSGEEKEGIVVRTQNYEKYGKQRSSFKVINNEYLLKEKL